MRYLGDLMDPSINMCTLLALTGYVRYMPYLSSTKVGSVYWRVKNVTNRPYISTPENTDVPTS